MDDIVNIYTQAFQLLDPKMLYNGLFLFLVKHTGSVKRIFEKYKNIKILNTALSIIRLNQNIMFFIKYSARTYLCISV